MAFIKSLPIFSFLALALFSTSILHPSDGSSQTPVLRSLPTLQGSSPHTHPISVNFYTFNHYPQPQQLAVTTTDAVFGSAIPVLLGYLQIYSSSTAPSPFQLHPLLTTASLASLEAYYLAFAAQLMFPAYSHHLGIAKAVSGSLCVAFLVCLIPHFPLPWWSLLILLSASALLLLLLKFHGLRIRRGGFGLPPQPPLLPLNSTLTSTLHIYGGS